MLTLAPLAACLLQAAPAPELVADLNAGPPPTLDADIVIGSALGRLWVQTSASGPDYPRNWIVTPGSSPPVPFGPASSTALDEAGLGSLAELDASRTLVTTSFGSDYGSKLWSYDGPSGAAVELLELPYGDFFGHVTVSSGTGYALSFDGAVYTTDGTIGGTALLEVLDGGGFYGGALPDLLESFLHPTPAGVLLLVKRSSPTGGLIEFRRIPDPATPSSVYLTIPAAEFSSPVHWSASDQGLFFARDEPLSGSEPWFSDGTTSGTRRLADLEPGAVGSGPQFGASTGGGMYFSATSTAAGRELWFSDGTPGGTRLFADATPGPTSSDVKPRWIAAVPNGAVFFAKTAASGREPWISDGTPGGTRLYADVTPGPADTVPAQPLQSGESLVVVGVNMEAGSASALVLDAATGSFTLLPPEAPISPWDRWAFINNRAYVAAGSLIGELWESDGTAPGTSKLTVSAEVTVTGDSAPGFPAVGRPELTELPQSTAGLTRTLLVAKSPDPTELNRLYSTDGSSAGTVDLGQPLYGQAVPFGDQFLFVGDDAAFGREPWITDGTPGGTRMLADLAPGPANGLVSYDLEGAEIGTRCLFVALTPNVAANGVWSTDGTVAGTGLLVAADSVLTQPRLGPLLDGRRLFGFDRDAGDPTGLERSGELWISDGTSAGTEKLIDLPVPVEGFSEPVGGFVYFNVFGFGVPGAGLWRTDGSSTGTTSSSLFSPNLQLPFGGVGVGYAALGDSLLLVAGQRLVQVDASGGVTELLQGSSFSLLGDPGPVAYVAEYDPNAGDRLWLVTEEVLPQIVLEGRSTVLHPVGSDGSVITVRTTPSEGREPFVIDGSTGAQIELPGAWPGLPSGAGEAWDPGPDWEGLGFAAQRLGNQVLVSLNNGVDGHELFAYGVADLGSWVAEPYGSGCGVNGPVRLELDGEARLGASVAVQLRGASNQIPAFLLASGEPANLPVGGCILALASVVPIVVGATDATGALDWPFKLSSDPFWFGRELYLQAATVVPGGPAAAAFELSNGLELVFGE